MPIFLQLCSVLAFSSFDCRFVCVEPKFEEKSKRFEAKPSQESNKTSSISPNQMIQGKKPANQKDHQNATERENRTTSASEHHGQPVVAATTVVPSSSPRLLWFPATLYLLTRLFFDLCCVLPLKRWCIWLKKGVEFIARAQKTPKIPLKKQKAEEEGLGEGDVGTEIERSTSYPSISFLISFSFFQFLQF